MEELILAANHLPEITSAMKELVNLAGTHKVMLLPSQLQTIKDCFRCVICMSKYSHIIVFLPFLWSNLITDTHSAGVIICCLSFSLFVVEFMEDPVFSVCCQNLIGCRQCIDEWQQNSPHCAKCRQITEGRNVFTVNGLSDALGVFTAISEE